jgi:hypothetical protein
MAIKNLIAFTEAGLSFGRNLNVMLFVSVYQGHYLEFEETWFDTCVRLGGLLQRCSLEKRIQALLDQCYLFWDEPEANLNPHLIKQVARTLVELSAHSIQKFIATRSLFRLRELEIVLADPAWSTVDTRFFGLHARDDGVTVEQGSSLDDIGDITSLEESLQQSDRYSTIRQSMSEWTMAIPHKILNGEPR